MKTSVKLFPAEFDPASYRLIHTPGTAARKHLYYVQEAGYLKTRRPLQTDRKNLNSYLFVTVVEGEGSLEVNGQRWTLEKGNCFLIDCRSHHTYMSSEAQPWALMWVHFNGLSSAYFAEQFRVRHDDLPISRNTPEAARTALSELMRLLQKETEDCELQASELLTRLLTALLLDRVPHSGAVQEQLPQIYAYLTEHYAEDISLEQLSEQFYVSKYHLARAFKEKYGDTVIATLIRLRISRAKELLRFSDASVGEISTLCGFHDQSYFNRQFRKTDGITASEYRKKWKN